MIEPCTHDPLGRRPDRDCDCGKILVPSALNVQAGGDHYKKLAIQPVEYIHENEINYMRGNVIKYVTRNKNGAEDIRKAIHYCQLILELEYGEKA